MRKKSNDCGGKSLADMGNNSDYFKSIEEFKDEFRSLLLNAVKEGLVRIHSVVKSGKFIGSYYDWPKLSYRENGLPILSQSFQAPKQYKDCFSVSIVSEPLIVESELTTFNDLIKFVNERPRLKERFTIESWVNSADEKYSDLYQFFVTGTIKDAIERYVHKYASFEFDESNLKDVVEPIVNFIFRESLDIDIVIPILFLKFDFDTFAIAEGIEIKRIADELHLARYKIKSNNVSVHESVVSSATHALVLKNWSIKNTKSSIRFDILSNPRAYPLDIIDKFFGAIRIATDFDTGYAQLMAVATNWMRHCKANLPNIEGAIMRGYPSKFEDYYWNLESIPQISSSNAEVIGKLFTSLEEAKENSINIALRRLNLCLVRDNEEDSVLDATIALEALLSDDDNQEMTHKLALRIGALSKLAVDLKKEPPQVFKDIKNIYSYRSAIVHGSKNPDKKRLIKIDEEKQVSAHSLAIEYLRVLLRILIDNPAYRDPKKIDSDLLLGKRVMASAVQAKAG